MNLIQWLGIKGNTAVRLSQQSKLTQPEISKLVHGKMPCSIRTAIMLDKGTDGAIKAEEVCTEHAGLFVYLRGTA